MKLLVSILVLVAVVTANTVPRITTPYHGFRYVSREPTPPVVESSGSRLLRLKTITQKLDHFDETNTGTWQMRYYDNNQYYAPGGPIFIYLGGEWEISPGWVMGGHMFDMAKEMSGYMFYTEHRYYGKSLPTTDSSTANLKYLDVNQALADVAHFIDVQRATLPGAKNSGVILVGGSYSATMAAWFRQKYPEKAVGAWASSAPLFAKVDFQEYKEVMTSAILNIGGQQCHDRIQSAIASLEDQVRAGNVASIKQKFNLCEDIKPTDNMDIWNFFWQLSEEFAGLVQTHSTGNIERACATILDASIADPAEAVGKWVTSLYGSSCVDYSYANFVAEFTKTEFTNNIMRIWTYQTCNEFAWFQTSTSMTQIFGSQFPLEYHTRMCADLFGSQFSPDFIQQQVEGTNLVHNGFSPQLTNVFFTHGEIDPWRPMGVQTDVNSDTPVVILEGHAHCKDLGSISPSDTPQLRATKERITSSVRKWLGM